MRSLVIGNSVSRKSIDYTFPWHKQFSIYGCNALYRDFEPHHLIATDKAMLQEIIDSGYHEGRKVYTLASVNEHFGKPVTTLPNQTEELCPSGIRAVKLALEESGHNKLYMLGMDFTNDNQYAGTPTYSDNWNFEKWIPEMEKLIKKYDKVNFYRIGAQKHNITPHSNFKELTIEQFTQEFIDSKVRT